MVVMSPLTVSEPPIETSPVVLTTAAETVATEILGVPVNPDAFVALVALVAVSALPVTSPVTSPLNVVAVITPVIFAPWGKLGASRACPICVIIRPYF